MPPTHTRWALVAAVALLASCRSTADTHEPRVAAPPSPATAPAPSPPPSRAPASIAEAAPGPRGILALIVSNQSSALPTVDIEVEIDGQRVLSEDFSLGQGHSFVEQVVQLPRGSHRIRAVSKKGQAEYRGTVIIKSKHWAALTYWFQPEGQGGDAIARSLRLEVSDTPLRMR